MFYPQEMTEVQVIIPEKDLISVTKALSDYRNFYQVDANSMSEEMKIDSVNSWKEQEANFSVQERRILNIMQMLGISNEHPPEGESVSMIESEFVTPLLDQIEHEVNGASEVLISEEKKLDQLNEYLHELELIAEADFDISELNNTQYIFQIIGVIPLANIQRLRTSLVRVPFVLVTLYQDNQKAVVWLAGSQRRANILERAARSAYLNPLKLPITQQGTPAEVIESLKNSVKFTKESISEQQVLVTRLTQIHNQQLQGLLWRVRASRMMADAIARYGQLQYTYLIVGWAPTSLLADLKQRLKKVSAESILDSFPTRRVETLPTVPVVLDNPRLISPFQNLVTTFAQPRYAEIDPTFLIALTFPLLFGAMFGDVGHGLLLALLGGLLMSRKVPALKGLAGLGGLVLVCGLAATVFGFLYGSVIGMENVLAAIWMRPMQNILQILMIAIGGGVVILTLGFILGIINAAIARDWGQFFFDKNGLAGFILYWSLLGLAASVFLKGFPIPTVVFGVLAGLAGIAVTLSEVLKHLVEGHRPLVEDGIGTYAIQAFFELFETLISFFSNTVSYVRVGAFAVAHGGLSAVIFIMANLVNPSHGVIYWIVVAGGTLVIVLFEGLIVAIQTMRLEYYELFSKFFKGGGTKQNPLQLLPAPGK